MKKKLKDLTDEEREAICKWHCLQCPFNITWRDEYEHYVAHICCKDKFDEEIDIDER